MNLDDVAVRLRSRGPNEALDLGFALVRHFWRAVYGGWFVCIVPIFAVATALGIWTATTWVPMLAVWLLKPLYDRVALFVVSRSLFGDVPTVRRTVGHALDRWFSWTALADLTYRRFSPFRGFILPIRELENQPGHRVGRRKKALLRNDVRQPAAILLGVCAAVEQASVLAFFALVAMLVPPEMTGGSMLDIEALQSVGTASPLLVGLSMVGYMVAISMVEVFYVAGSFGLYINRRVKLEGWDVELDFKRLARRLEEPTGRTSRTDRAAQLLVAGLAALLVGLWQPAGVVAQTPGQPEATPAQTIHQTAEETDGGEGAGDDTEKPAAQKKIDEILKADEFGEKKTEWVWERIEEPEPEEQSDWDLGIGSAVASFVEVLLWLVIAAAAVGFAWLLIRKAGEAAEEIEGESAGAAPDPVVRDVEEAPEVELPREMVEAAVERWERGDYEASLSALYQGTIRGLSEGYGIEIAPYMTARECTRKVQMAGGPGEYVARLADAWTAAAYADRPPTDRDARRLFGEWRDHFTAG